jgi:hypothetical protein
MMLERVSSGPIGFEHRLFECPKCDHVELNITASDPFKSNAAGWFAGELRAPNWGDAHARYPKPGAAMHGLRFADEVDGDWAEHVGPGLAYLHLPSLQEGTGAYYRQHRHRGLVEAQVRAWCINAMTA